ncbi:MAG: hypothetical protein RL291_982, partial [Pseudomonadota bacterium]
MFLAPVLAAIGGLGTIGSALVSAGISLALGYAARKLAPEPTPQQFATFGARGHRLSLNLDPNTPREVIFGLGATAGSLVYRHVFGANDAKLHLVFALADHECDSLSGIIVDGRPVTWDAGTGLVAEYGTGMKVTFHSGAYDQSADAGLVASSGGRWTNDDRGRGVCYVAVELTYNEVKFAGGVPRFLFLVKGAKFYDWRKDGTNGGSGSHRWGQPATYEWSDNPMVCLYNYRRGVFIGANRVAGMNTPASALPVSDWTAAANACDELVGLRAGGTEKRYRVNAIMSTSEEHREVIRAMLSACAGREIDTGGELKPMPGISQAPVLTVTDDDLIADAPIEISPKMARNDLVNAVFGSFHDPAQQYEGVALPPRLSSADETADGGVRLEQHYSLDYVTSHAQGQRILEIFRRRGRHQMQVQCRLRSRFSVLEAGDWIAFTSSRYGWVSKTFEIVSALPGEDLTVQVTLMETGNSVYAWVPADDEINPLDPPDLPGGGTALTTVEGFTIANVTLQSGETQRPGLQAQWEPINDLTVIAILIEYRQEGDTIAIERRAEDPKSGAYTWVEGVLGGAIYEARARLITNPARDLTWTSWTSAETAADPIIVDESVAEAPGAGSIGVEQLDAQARFELSLVTAREAVDGAVAQSTAAAFDWAQRAAQSNLAAALAAAGTRSLIKSEQIQRHSGDSALAADVRTVTSSVNSVSATVTQTQQSVDGLAASWGISVDANGRVLGAVRLDGEANGGSQFTIVADRFAL